MKAACLTALLCCASLPGACLSAQSSASQAKANAKPGPAKVAHIENDWGIPVEVLPDGTHKPLWKGDGNKVKSAAVISVDSPQAIAHPAPSRKPAATAPQKAIPKDKAPNKGADAKDNTGDTSAQPADPNSAARPN